MHTLAVVVPACASVVDEQPPDLVEAVRAAHGNGARIVSVCPGAFVLAAETTSLPVDQIAERSGLGSPANLRHHFTRAVGVPPTAYRRTFALIR